MIVTLMQAADLSCNCKYDKNKYCSSYRFGENNTHQLECIKTFCTFNEGNRVIPSHFTAFTCEFDSFYLYHRGKCNSIHVVHIQCCVIDSILVIYFKRYFLVRASIQRWGQLEGWRGQCVERRLEQGKPSTYVT